MQLTSANKIWRKRTENCGELEKGFAELKVAKEQLEVLVKRYERLVRIDCFENNFNFSMPGNAI